MRNSVVARFVAALVVSAPFFLAPFAGAAPASEALPAAQDPILEKQAMQIASQLRCLVCQNQTIADSSAALAVDLKQQIREQLRKGASEADITAYMVARYGDFILYKPPFKASTALLWLGPLLLLLAGLGLLLRVLSRRQGAPAAAELTPEQSRRARALLEGERPQP